MAGWTSFQLSFVTAVVTFLSAGNGPFLPAVVDAMDAMDVMDECGRRGVVADVVASLPTLWPRGGHMATDGPFLVAGWTFVAAEDGRKWTLLGGRGWQ